MEAEVLGKPIGVSGNRFVQIARANSIKSRQIGICDDPLAANHMDALLDFRNRNDRVHSAKELPVQAPILDGFQQVRRGDRLRSGKVGDRARDLQDPVVGPRRELELLHRVLKQVPQFGVEGAVFADLAMGHAGVEVRLGLAEARRLQLARGEHALAHRRGCFPRRSGSHLSHRERGRLDVKVDPVEQRAAYPGPIVLDLRRGAAASALRVAEVPAGAGVQCQVVILHSYAVNQRVAHIQRS